MPTPVLGLASGVTAIATAGSHACALTVVGAVHCWGANFYGGLGDGTTTERHVPTPVIGLASGVVAISSGGFDTCALTVAGAAQCWGYNGVGQIGDGTMTDRLVPTPVLGLASGVAAILTSNYHTCAVTVGGGAQCWGWNNHGQLGDGTNTRRLVPRRVATLTSGVLAVTAGGDLTCASTISGAMHCWGENLDGGLGDGA